jgi:predicted nucleic acid-binding protein
LDEVTANRVLIDTGPLVATFRQRDKHHRACLEIERQLQVPQFTCWPVITEAVYLLSDSVLAVQNLLGKIVSGDLIILPITRDDVPAIAEVIATYSDQAVDFADACLVHLAERETITTIFTVDRRHFSVYRTASGKAFTLLPE